VRRGCKRIRGKQKALLERLEQRLASMRRPHCDPARFFAVQPAEQCLKRASEHILLPMRKMSDQRVTQACAPARVFLSAAISGLDQGRICVAD
jgi:hypothetical protein